MKSGRAQELTKGRLVTTPQERIADDFIQQIENKLTVTSDIVENAIEHILYASRFSTQTEISTFVYYAVEEAVLEQIQTTILG